MGSDPNSGQCLLRKWGQIPIRGSAFALANKDSPIWALTPFPLTPIPLPPFPLKTVGRRFCHTSSVFGFQFLFRKIAMLNNSQIGIRLGIGFAVTLVLLIVITSVS